MYTLFIDTHQNTNLAIFKDKNLIGNLDSHELRQSTVIMPLLKKLLEEYYIKLKDINQIIVVNGPGSFTGVRLGVTIAKTIAHQLQIPIKTLNSLELMALMDNYNNTYYGVKDAKGIYLGINKNKIITVDYKNNVDIVEENIVTDVTFDYIKLIYHVENFKNTNPHKVNPLYIKKIEAQK